MVTQVGDSRQSSGEWSVAVLRKREPEASAHLGESPRDCGGDERGLCESPLIKKARREPVACAGLHLAENGFLIVTPFG